MSSSEESRNSRKPFDLAFNQQKMISYRFNCSIMGYIVFFLAAGLYFVPMGVYFRKIVKATHDASITYDGPGIDSTCSISSGNEGKVCSLSFTFDKDISGPIYVYYQLDEFYQNHRTYVKSRSSEQLLGENLDYDEVYSDCYPLIQNGSLLLNPCGLIANTFFNDVIEYISTDASISMDTDGIAWSYDEDKKFAQVDGFAYVVVTNFSLSCAEAFGSSSYTTCSTYNDTATNTLYYYYYPDDDTVQYLHETYPDNISPIKGVTDPRFVNWMRTAGLPKFRKLYGKIDADAAKGDTWTFNITNNYEVASFGASKSLVITNLSSLGAPNMALGNVYLAAGVWALLLGFLLAIWQALKA